MTPLVHPAAVRCFHGPSCYHPQTSFPPLPSAADFQPRFCRRVNRLLNISVALTFSPYVSLTFLPIVETESLNTSVRVCFAQPSHSGAECDPRHRGAVLAWESNHHKAPPLIGPSQAVTDTLTESTDTLAAGPKNGYFRIHQISDPSCMLFFSTCCNF